MLFRKDIPKVCAHCQHAVRLDSQDMLCRRHGVVGARHSCRRFRYDPTKRVPLKPKMPNFDLYDQTDFIL